MTYDEFEGFDNIDDIDEVEGFDNIDDFEAF